MQTRHILPLFIIASLAVHTAALWCWPDNADLPSAQHPGDAGLQLTLARSAAGRPGASETREPARRQPAIQAPAPALQAASAPVVSAPAHAAVTDNAMQADAPARATAADTAAGSPLQVQLLDALQPYFHYPVLARRRGWEGTVQVGLRVHANGRISDVRIIETSHHAVLDRAALDCLASIGQLPGAVAWLDGRDSDIVLPVEYRLTDG